MFEWEKKLLQGGNRALILKAGEGSHIYQGEVRVCQQQPGPVNPDLVDIGRDVFAGILFENAAQICLAEMHMLGDIIQGYLTEIVAADILDHLVYRVGVLYG